MTTVKVCVLDSSPGPPHPVAERLAQVAAQAGAEVRVGPGPELMPPEDLDWADVLLLGSPTQPVDVTGHLDQMVGRLKGKVCAGFTVSGAPVRDSDLESIDHMAERCVEIAYRLKVSRAA